MNVAVTIFMVFFVFLMIWLGISTWYEFRYQLPFLKVREDYPEKNSWVVRVLLRFMIIGAQITGWTFLLLIFYDHLANTYEWNYENGIPSDFAQDLFFLLFKISIFTFFTTFSMTFAAISISPAILWLPFKMITGYRSKLRTKTLNEQQIK